MIRKRFALGIGVTLLSAAALTGCGGSSDDGGSGDGSSGDAKRDGGGRSSAQLATTDSPQGEIIVDGKGMTVYVYDKDEPNARKSACTGDCTAEWPAVKTRSASPKVEGISGKVSTIKADGGGRQITVNGQPLYTFAADAKAGDVEGQGDEGVWYVVAPSGKKITTEDGTGGGGY